MARSRSPIASSSSLVIAWQVVAAALPFPAVATVSEPTVVRGVVRSTKQAMISTELQVRVSMISRKEGERFLKGDVLVELDCRRQRAELASAEAQLVEMKLSLDNNKVLRQAQAVGKHDLDISQSRVTKAAADAEALRVRLDQCSVVAPFDGYVLELGIFTHETTQPGKPFIGIVAHDQLEIDLIVPADWLRRVQIGAQLSLLIDELKSRHPIDVTRVGAAVDPVSQTIKITAQFTSDHAGILPGMSGTAEMSGRRE